MILLSRALLPLLLDRLSGQDGYYTAFRLAFYHGGDPATADGSPDDGVLAQFNFPSPWPTRRGLIHITKTGPIYATITATGLASHWRLVGFRGGGWSTLVHGSIGLVGSAADIKVRTLDWVIGDLLTLKTFQIFPLRLSY